MDGNTSKVTDPTGTENKEDSKVAKEKADNAKQVIELVKKLPGLRAWVIVLETAVKLGHFGTANLHGMLGNYVEKEGIAETKLADYYKCISSVCYTSGNKPFTGEELRDRLY